MRRAREDATKGCDKRAGGDELCGQTRGIADVCDAVYIIYARKMHWRDEFSSVNGEQRGETEIHSIRLFFFSRDVCCGGE